MDKLIRLNGKERVELQQLIRSGINSARVIGRARTLLLLGRRQGKKRTVQEVAEAAMVSLRDDLPSHFPFGSVPLASSMEVRVTPSWN